MKSNFISWWNETNLKLSCHYCQRIWTLTIDSTRVCSNIIQSAWILKHFQIKFLMYSLNEHRKKTWIIENKYCKLYAWCNGESVDAVKFYRCSFKFMRVHSTKVLRIISFFENLIYFSFNLRSSTPKLRSFYS